MSAPGRGAREADRGSSGEILQPLVTLLGPYSLHPPAPLGAAVGLTELHCEDQEQPDHAYQIANLAHAYAALGALPRGEREIFTPMGSGGASVMLDGGLHVEDSHHRTGVTQNPLL